MRGGQTGNSTFALCGDVGHRSRADKRSLRDIFLRLAKNHVSSVYSFVGVDTGFSESRTRQICKTLGASGGRTSVTVSIRMTKLISLFYFALVAQIFGQTPKTISSQLVGKWVLKEQTLAEKGTCDEYSLRVTLEFKQNNFYTIKCTYLYKNPMIASTPRVRTGKWKVDSIQNKIHLYKTLEESPSPHEITNEDLEIIKLTKKKLIVREDLTPCPGKSIFARKSKYLRD